MPTVTVQDFGDQTMTSLPASVWLVFFRWEGGAGGEGAQILLGTQVRDPSLRNIFLNTF